MLRLSLEGHSCDWFLLTDQPAERRILKGLIPEPLEVEPDFSNYDLCIFDSTGHGEQAEEIRKVCAVIGDGELNSKLEDDRLFGIQIMEQCGIKVPRYSVFKSPEEARAWLTANPRRYVYKAFTQPGIEQDPDTTYVSDSCEDMSRCLDQLFKDSSGTPFMLQEVVEGTEVSTEGWFDGSQFHWYNHTLEEKKLMSGGHGPNTGCAGNLIWTTNGPSKLFQMSVMPLTEFLRSVNYRGMIDVNCIVQEQHCFGLEFTPRFGYDASATLFATTDGNLGNLFYNIATGPKDFDPIPPGRGMWAASQRCSIPPYPEEVKGKHPRSLPIKGIPMDKVWRHYFLYDAMRDNKSEDEEAICTAGINGFVCCPIASAHTPEGAWDGVERLSKNLKIPNMQVRDDLKECTLERLKQLREMGWV